MFDELNRNVVHLNKQVALLRDENDRLKVALTESETSLDELMNERKNLVEGTTEAEIYRMHTQDRIERKQQELEEALNKVRQKEDEIDL
jgi:ABC-type transporter Mla subunit MlaD